MEEEEHDASKLKPESPNSVDDIREETDKSEAAVNIDNNNMNDNIISESDSESDDDEDDFEDAQEEEAQGEEAIVEELDASALLAFSKSRLQKDPPTETNDNSEEDAGDNNTGADLPSEEKKIDTINNETDAVKDDDEEPVVKDQAYFIELAMRKAKEAEIKAKNDEDPAYLMKLAEKKVAQANAMAKEDEDSMGDNVVKPVIEAKPTRSENSELWALLNYSKQRIETGATPQVGGSKKSGSKGGSTRGDDNMSVSSKLSKSSKRSLGSKNIAVVGGPGDGDAPFPDVTDNGDASVDDGSVSLDDTATKNHSVANEDEESDQSDEDEESSDEDEEEEEEELPDFLKNEEEAVDAEEAKALYEAAKFKAASILSVSEEKLTDVQMLQAIAIAEEAAKKGDEKFSTKRSLFKLNEAKVEDLKAFLNLSSPTQKDGQQNEATTNEQNEAVGWGIGRGRLLKKLGNAAKSFKERCEEIDEQKQREREGQPTAKEMFDAGMLDLKKQIQEIEKIAASKKKP